ncbi:MAG: bacteriohemerythrin [Magnetococcales bacterium]|nr:bacteriohemerythrin [Magnetococcales bacterium]
MKTVASIWDRIGSSISLRILTVVGIIGIISLTALGGLLIRDMEHNLLEQNDATIRKLADLASQGLQTIMLAGYSDIAKNYSENLKKIPELQEFLILNRFGKEAFQGNVDRPLPVDEVVRQNISRAVSEKQAISLIVAGEDGPSRVMLVPLLNREACHACHGQDHEVRGVFLLSLSLTGVVRQIDQARLAAMVVVAAAVTLFLLLLGIILTRSVKRPLHAISLAIDETARGNLTDRITHAGRDEIARIAHNINHLKEQMINNIRMINLQSGSITAFIKEVLKLRTAIDDDAGGIRKMAEEVTMENRKLHEEVSRMRELLQQADEQIAFLARATGEVAASIQGSASNTDKTSESVETVSTAAVQMMGNVKEVNATLTQVNAAVGHVSESMQEMTTAFVNIRQRCQQASSESREAHHHAQATFSAVSRLSLSAGEIGKVVELINNIAEQTNILALNASIEAAGGGSLGAGFAVVANEVKELARQTGDATHVITDKIATIQQDTSSVAEEVKGISGIIARINAENDHILQAVDAQHGTVQEISSAMCDVSQATEAANHHIGHLNSAAQEVAQEARQAAHSTSAIASTSADIAHAAQRMAEQSDRSLQFIRTVLTSSEQTEKSSVIVRTCIQETLSVVSKLQGTVNHFRALGDVASNISDALYAAQSTLDVGSERFDVRQIKESLLNLLGRLERAVHGHALVSLDEIMQGCQLCQLTEELAVECGDQLLFRKLQESHQQMHRTCQEVVQRVQERNNIPAALQAVRFFQALIHTLFEQLDMLYLGKELSSDAEELLIRWHSGLSVAVPALDRDHQKLIDMINELFKAVKHSKGQSILEAILGNLVEYTQTHFDREERHMLQIGYPQLDKHRVEHQQFIERIGQFKRKWQEDPFALSSDMLQYLRKWLLQHIQGSDRDYSRWQGMGKRG